MNKFSTSILILQGYVVNIGKGQTRVICPTSGKFDVKWYKDYMPNIKVGQYITFTGRMITYDLGRDFIIVAARILKPRSLMKIKQVVYENLKVEDDNAENDGSRTYS